MKITSRRALPLSLLLAIVAGCLALSIESCGGPQRSRVLVVGWGGATWNIVDKLLETGKLPNLARMIERGEHAELESTRPPTRAAAWAALATGRQPGETGVGDWFETTSEDTNLVVNDASSLPVAFVWEELPRPDQRAFVFGAPLSAPAREMNGTLVAGSPVTDPDRWTFPNELQAELESRGIDPDPTGLVTTGKLTVESYFEQFGRKREYLLEKLANEPWDLAWISFEELGPLHELCWPGPREGDLIRAYVQMDKLLGELVELAGDPTNVLVVSERGTRLYTHAFGLHAMLLHEGFTAVNGPLQPFTAPANSSLLQREDAEHKHRLSGYEAQLTRATANVCAGNFGSVRAIVKPRESWAYVPFENYSFVLSDLKERISSIESDRTLEPVTQNTWTIDELYPGEHTDRLADFVFEFDDTVLLTNDLFMRKFRDLDPPVSGAAREGLFIASGPSFERTDARGTRSIFEVAGLTKRLLGGQ